MKNRPLATISLILGATLMTMMAPVFDSSVYGINGHPTEWMSFMPSAPLRNSGIGILLSPFIHMNWQHLLTNMIFLTPVALMIERKAGRGYLWLRFFLLHLFVLSALYAAQFIIPMEGKAFLGASHVVTGMFTFWGLTTRSKGMLFLSIAMVAGSAWQSQDSLTIAAHLTGATMGIMLFVVSSLLKKLRLQGANQTIIV